MYQHRKIANDLGTISGGTRGGLTDVLVTQGLERVQLSSSTIGIINTGVLSINGQTGAVSVNSGTNFIGGDAMLINYNGSNAYVNCTGVFSINGMNQALSIEPGPIGGIAVEPYGYTGLRLHNTGVLTFNGDAGNVTGLQTINGIGWANDTGVLTMGNVKLVGGTGITVSGLTVTNTGCLSVNGQAGHVTISEGGSGTTYTAGSNITIANGVISATGGTGGVSVADYQAGTGIYIEPSDKSIVNTGVLSVNGQVGIISIIPGEGVNVSPYVFVDGYESIKVDNLGVLSVNGQSGHVLISTGGGTTYTAGSNISITNGVISATAGVASINSKTGDFLMGGNIVQNTVYTGTTIENLVQKTSISVPFYNAAPNAGIYVSALQSGMPGQSTSYTLSNTGVLSVNGFQGDVVVPTGVTSYAQLTNLPTLFSGSYTDLTNKPVLTLGDITTALEYVPMNTVSYSNLSWDNTNQRLGIGTTAPQASLDLSKIRLITTNAYGKISMARTDGALACHVEGTSSTINLRYAGGSRGKLQVGSSLSFYGNTDTTLRMILDGTSGNMGIAVATPTEKLHVGGNMLWTGVASGNGSNITYLDYDNIALNKPITPYAISIPSATFNTTYADAVSWTQAAGVSTTFRIQLWWIASNTTTPRFQFSGVPASEILFSVKRGANNASVNWSTTTAANLYSGTLVGGASNYSEFEGTVFNAGASTIALQLQSQGTGATMDVVKGTLFVQKLESSINIV